MTVLDSGPYHNNNEVFSQKNSRCLTNQQVCFEYREPFITSGYRRPGFTFWQCIYSLCEAHNETINVWSHLVAVIGFLFLCVPMFVDNNPLQDSFVYPLLAYAMGICAMFIMSSFAHLFNCMSIKVRHICFFLDYAAISTYTFTAGQVFFFYSRPTNTDVYLMKSSTVFLAISAFISVASTYMCCASRHAWIKHKFLIRTGTYSLSWVYNTLPYISRTLLCESPIDCNTESFKYFKRQVMYFFVAAIANACRIPERFIPGLFDFFGQSHHFLHILCALGSVDDFIAVYLDMTSRREILTGAGMSLPTFWNSIGLMLIVLTTNIGIVIWFAIKCPHDEKNENKYSKSKKLKFN